MAGSQYLRVWLKWMAITVLGSATVLAPLLSKDLDNQVEIVAGHQSSYLIGAEHDIHSAFWERLGDTRVVARSPEVRRFLNTGGASGHSDLAALFRNVCESYGVYDQIRLLNPDGQEIVRVDRDEGRCAEVPGARLQNKAHRYYVQAIRRLEPGQQYVSPLDHNIEHGIVEASQGPIIRFGILLGGPSGEPLGMLVLNYRAADLLNRLFPADADSQDIPVENFLVTGRGDYLKSDQVAEYELTALNGRLASFEQDYPTAWQAVAAGQERYRGDDGLYLFNRIDTPIVYEVTDASTKGEQGPSSQWHLVQFIPDAQLLASSVLHGQYRLVWLAIYGLVVLVLSASAAGIQIRRSEFRLQSDKRQALLRAAGDGVHILDNHGNLVEFSQSFAGMLGYSSAEAARLNVIDWDARFEPGDVAGIVQRLMLEPATFETVHRRKDGSTFDVEVNAKGIEIGGQTFLYAASRDISQRKLDEQALRTVHQRMRLAADSAGIGVWDLDLAENLLVWDEWMFRLYGVDAAQFDGTIDSWKNCLHPDDVSRTDREVRAALENDRPFDSEFRICRPDGSIRHIKGNAVVIRDDRGSALRMTGINYDITAQREAEAALRASEERFRHLFDSSPDPVWIIEGEHFVECNQAAVDMLGYPDKQALTDTHPADLSPERQPDGESSLSKAQRMLSIARRKGANRFEWVHRRRAGSDFFVEVTLAPIVLQGHDAIYCTWRDLTERKQEEARFRAMFDGAQDGILIADIETRRLINANPAICGMLGYEAEELVTLGVEDVHPPAALPEILDGFHRGAKGEEVDITFLETDMLRKDGSEFTAEVNVATFDIEGRLAVAGFFRDVTERKAIEAEIARHRDHLEDLVDQRTTDLKEANQKLLDTQFAMESVGIGIHWVDAETGRLLYVNPVAAALLGYTPEEMTRLRVPDIDPNFPPDAFEAIKHTASEQGYVQTETSQRTKDGRDIPVEVSVYHLAGREGSGDRLIVFVTDISRRKEQETALQQAKKAAEAAAEAKSTFLANMSHEIRTPLNGILGLSRISVRENAGRRAGQIAGKILKSGEHLLGVIDDILDFSKLESGKLVISPAPFDLGGLVKDAVAMIADRAGEKSLTLDQKLAPQLPQWVMGDSLRIRQILINLLSNAVKFTEQGGVAIEVHPQGEQILFSITDTGIGMDEGQLAELFQPFQQADASISRRFGGTGLGLAISRQLAYMMGGGIEVTSAPDVGSRFTLVLPLPQTDARPAHDVSKHPDDEAPLQGLRVLAAEDVEVNREVLEDMLTVAGALPVLADNGQEAVNRVAADPDGFDVVLMDIQMPVMDGLEAARRIRSIAPKLPVIALSAHALREEQERSRAVGMVDHLTKPIQPMTLVQGVLAHAGPLSAGRNIPAMPKADTPTALTLPEVDGLDLKAGLEVMVGNPDRYRRMLTKFANNYREHGQRMADHLRAGELPELQLMAHSLKGTAATLGAMPLSEVAAELESAVREVVDEKRQATDLRSPLHACTEVLDDLITALQRKL